MRDTHIDPERNSSNDTRRQEVFQEAREQARVARKNIAAKAGQTARETKDKVYEQFEHQKNAVAQEVHDVNTAILKTADNLDNSALEKQLRGLAGQVEKTAQHLEDAAAEDVVEALEDFSRTQPALFLAASFTVGLLAGRFFNATRPDRMTSGKPGAELGSRTIQEGAHHAQPLVAR